MPPGDPPAEQPVPVTEPRALRWWMALGAGLAHAVLLFMSMPPLSLWGLALVAVLPVAWLACRTARPFRDGTLATVGVTPFWAATHLWIWDVAPPGFPVLVLLLSLYTLLFVVSVVLVRRAFPRLWLVVVVPGSWVTVEFFRAHVAFDGYAWYQLGHPMIDAGPLAMVGRVGGVELATVLVAVFAVGVLRLISSRGRAGFGAIAGALALSGICWLTTIGASRPTDVISVAVVQTNVPQDNKTGWAWSQRVRDFREMLAFSLEAGADEDVAFIVWPETMFPGLAMDADAAAVVAGEELAVPIELEDGTPAQYLLSDFRDELLRVQALIGKPIVVGAEGVEGFRINWDGDGDFIQSDARFNSVFVLADGDVRPERYDKVWLTPFGERMPYIDAWPWLEAQLLRLGVGASGMTFSLSAGEDQSTLRVPSEERPLRISTPVCFEITVSGHVRRLSRDADVIVNLTNDGWFGDSVGGRLAHLQQARWRAFELGTPMVRAANTGVSAVIGRDGRVTSLGGVGTGEVISGVVSIGAGRTVFIRGGWLFGPIAASLGGLTILSSGIVLLVRGRGRAREAE